MVDQDCFFLPHGSGSRIGNSSCINMMEREGSWKPNVDLSPACPRCGSSNTKFCYYNNYSLTQPRYFCKGCRRYWTKGGSLRNVPVGGGCRKSRRTNIKPPSPPPIRVPSSVTLSTNIIHGNVVVPSPFGLISATQHRHSPSGTSTTPATPSSNGPNIDLAMVYANFLNPNKIQPPPEPASYHHHHHHQQHHETIPQLPNDNTNIIDNSPGPSFEFLCAQNNLHLDLTAPHQQGLGHDDNYVVYHSSELDSIHHHHLFTNVSNNDFSNNINSNNYVLPPMPDNEELLAVSQEMAWPSGINNAAADLMLPASNQIMDVNQSSPPSSAVQPQERNCQRTSNENDDEMNSLINIPNFEDIFKT